MKEANNFIGRGWSFPPTFNNVQNTVEMLEGRDDIESSLQILLTTTIGSRVMQPRFGCNLVPLIFEPLNAGIKAYIRDLIETAIILFEPRIILNDVFLESTDEEGTINIDVEYTITATNTRYNFVYPFLEEEVPFLILDSF